MCALGGGANMEMGQMSGFAVKPRNKKAEPKESSSSLLQQIAEDDSLKMIEVNLQNVTTH